MKINKKLLVAFLTVAALPINANAFIPVFDPTQMAEVIANRVQQAADMATTIQNQIQQIQQLQTQVQALTGARSLGDILNNPLLRDYIPQNYVSLVQAVQSGSPSQLSSAIQAIKDQEAAAAAQGNPVDRLKNAGYIAQATAQQALQAQENRLDNIKSLQAQINTVTDPRAAQDLANRIAIESAQVQADTNRIALMKQINEQNIEVAKQAEFDSFQKNHNHGDVCNKLHPCA